MSILFGLIAALGWGLHDIIVRQVSQHTPLFAALLWVLVSGSIFQLIAVAWRGDFAFIPNDAILPVFMSGIMFTVASIGLYKAFEIGPVQLVSPLIATFAILSTIWGAAMGSPVSVLQWLAVLTVFIGVCIVAIMAERLPNGVGNDRRAQAIGWSLLSSVGFAGTFGLGHSVMHVAPEMMIILLTRVISIAALLVIMIWAKSVFFPGKDQFKILTIMGLLDAIALSCVLASGNLPNASYAAVVSSAFGLVTILLAWAFLREPMRAIQWFGALITFSGIAVLSALNG